MSPNAKAKVETKAQEDASLALIARIIAEVEQSDDDQTDLLLEHLESARVYLQGAMPEEYDLSLNEADIAGGELADPSLRKSVTEGIAALRRERRS